MARDRFVHSYQKAVADFDKKNDLEHRIGESKPWYEALIKRCAKALDDIDGMENDYLRDIEVVEAILTQHCGWRLPEDVSAAHAPRLSQSRGQAIERWNGALGELTLNSTRKHVLSHLRPELAHDNPSTYTPPTS